MRRFYKIGDHIKDNKRDFILTEHRKVFDKNHNSSSYYKYKCNKCGYDCSGGYRAGQYISETWYTSSQLSRKDACTCCSGKTIVPNINSIYATRKELVKYFENEEDSKRYGLFSNQKIKLKCPCCGTKKTMIISNFTKRGFACPICSDKFSLGERIMYYLLLYIDVGFIKELTKTTFEWCKNFRYDFYISDLNIIIEINGLQHKNGGFSSYGGRTLKEEIINDNSKRILAFENNIEKYIVIDASVSDFNYIKNSILQSELYSLFDFSSIDWNEIYHMVYFNTLVKDICNMWNENNTITFSEIEEKFHISNKTIIKYLKIGNKLNWCIYNQNNRKENHYDNIYKNDAKNSSSPIKCIDNNVYFKSIILCEKNSENIFGRRISRSTIRYILSGTKTKYHKVNVNFSYVTQQEFNDAIENGYKCYGSPFIIAS